MSITDELRKWGYGFCGSTYEVVNAIADRIDARHERECADSLMRGHDAWATVGNEDVIAERGWIKLPVDADGKVIHIDDELVLQHEVAETPSVVQSITWDGEDWYFTCDEGFFNVCGWVHHQEPTVEDVLQKLLEQAVGYSDAHTTVALDTIAEFSAKLRLAEGVTHERG